MQHEGNPSLTPHICQRFASLIWSCIDADLHKSAVFYAERYYVMDPSNHDARHLYATALLRSGQPHSAHHLVDQPSSVRCSGCLEIKSKCCTALGKNRLAREALEESLRDPSYKPTPSMGSRAAKSFPEQSVLHCRSGATAMKGNLPERAIPSFRQALALNPFLWEAFEGLCSLGDILEIDDLFPPRRPPTKQAISDFNRPVPVATGAGFFTPDAGNGGNLFVGWKPDVGLPTHSEHVGGLHDSMTTDESSFDPEGSFHQGALRASRSQPTSSLAVHPPAVRPLSSADEAGPVTKKLRSTVRQRTAPSSTNAADSNVYLKPSKSTGTLLLGQRDQPKSLKAAAISFRSQLGVGKSAHPQPVGGMMTRRSTRLLNGLGNKPVTAKYQQATIRGRRRLQSRTRVNAVESGSDEESLPEDAIAGPSTLSSTNEEGAQETYDAELADFQLYELMRMFARAARAMALYDCRTCLDELEKLPMSQKWSAWVMAMVGKAHYELGEYVAAERAFEAVRNLEPYRLWDMEVFSTLLWHRQENVKLSFLAQELVSTDPRAPQAWIAVGNCFSLQKERPQALTCFRRAAQLDPNCAYAYTLSGHESIDEDVDKAINFFESALRADPRHYNAWYGLGTCYMRMSKIRLADYHYRKALQIHPRNAVLLGCVGMVTERLGDRDQALSLFNEAVRLSPENALVRYRRAKILIALKQYAAAVKDLERLRETSPEESNVIFQLAKAYRLLGNNVKSAELLAVARDVSPKSVDKIRKLLETVRDPEADVMDEG
ncbi:TPR-like protein [Laetiporus sulphureus 93-53]|uniref:TPR-like protein n=1 Tax=Laetiporus sulphureus 93-53 TaxID=1314785 RepID=A0A165HAL3_9APHY|nr:TPR-like protein [Laetiporus sulphureus 93-53]KZT11471.1 TPR-like protein [Laetiporus sulphureus 93-53]